MGHTWLLVVRDELFLWLHKKLSNQLLLFLIFDSSEELGSQTLDCLWAIERQMRVHLSTTEVAGLAAGLKDGFDLGRKIYVFR